MPLSSENMRLMMLKVVILDGSLYPSGSGIIWSMGEGGFGGIFHVGLSPSHVFIQAQIYGSV